MSGVHRSSLRRLAVVDGEVVGVTGEPRPRDDGPAPAAVGRWLGVLGGAFEHPADQADVDRLRVERPRARRVDPFGAPLLDEAEQRVDLAHLRPRQRDVQQRCRRRRRSPHRGRRRVGWRWSMSRNAYMAVPSGRSSGSVDTPAGLLAGVDLDELAAVEDPHQLPVGADLDACAEQVPGDRVERLGDLDVMIPMHLRGRVDRHVVTRGRRAATVAAVPRRRNSSTGAALRRAVDPHPGPRRAPRLGRRCASARSMKVSPAQNELRTNCTSARHAACPAGCAPEPGRSRTRATARTRRTPRSTAAPADRRRRRSASGCRGSPCGTRHRRTATPLRTQRSQRRVVCANDNHTNSAARTRREDQRLTHPPSAVTGRRAAQPAEVDLQLVTRLAISDPHRRPCTPAAAAHLAARNAAPCAPAP